MLKTAQNQLKSHRGTLYITIFVLAVIIGGYAVIHEHTQPLQAPVQKQKTATIIPSTKSKTQVTSNSSSTNTTLPNSSSVSQDKSLASPASGSPFIAPTGTFVSNHRPDLTGQPIERQEQSVCTTIPGASCYIEFIKNGLVEQLATQTADANGSCYWTWDISQAGLTGGSWTVIAVATAGSQTKTTQDSIALVVQP